MTRKVCLGVMALGLVLCGGFAQAAQYPIVVYPDPAQFGTVPLNSTSYLTFYVSNVSSNSVNVTSMAVSGANAGDFGFNGPNCVGTISAGQTCQMSMTLTPSAMGALAGNLVIAVGSSTQKLTIPLQGTGGNPIPTITSLSPSVVYLNSPSLTMTVNGSGFVPGAVVSISNNALTTTFVSATQLTAQVPASYFTSGSYDFVAVTNPAPGGGTSSSVNLQVISLEPQISNSSPSSVIAGSTPTPLVINGSSFMTGATVQWNGKAIPTTYISTSQLQVQPTTTQLAGASIVQLAVSNPSPGGLSAPVTFNITYPTNVTILDLPANDIVWDPFTRHIYASLPSIYGSNGNTIAVINPSNGAVLGYHFAGSEPTKLAISADGNYLYAGLNGNGSVQRFLLPKFTPDINVSLGSSSFGGLNIAEDLKVSPPDSHTFAVALGTQGCCGSGPLEFFTDSTLLANTVTYPTITDIVFPSATTLYGYSGGTLSQVSVSSSGGTLSQQWGGLVNGDDILYDSGLIYGSDGQVFNPSTGTLVGTYDVGNFCCGGGPQLLPDSAINRVFVLGITPFFNAFGVTSYNLSRFTPIAVANLSQLNGSATPSFIQWGSNGLAFILQSGCCGNPTTQVVALQSAHLLMTVSASKSPAPVSQSLSPASTTHGRGNLILTVHGTGFVPGSQVTWNGSQRSVDYISSTQIKVYIPATDLISPGTANLVITNPAPGGGKNVITFTIN